MNSTFTTDIISHNITRKLSITKVLITVFFVWAVFNVLIYNQVLQYSPTGSEKITSVVWISTVVFLAISLILLIYRIKGFVKKKGSLNIYNDSIEIVTKDIARKFRLEDIENINVIYSHYRVPLLMLPGNRNIIGFNCDEQKHRYEFLIKSEDHKNLLRSILTEWNNNGINFVEANTKGEPLHLLENSYED
jgi:hypothetical protein